MDIQKMSLESLDSIIAQQKALIEQQQAMIRLQQTLLSTAFVSMGQPPSQEIDKPGDHVVPELTVAKEVDEARLAAGEAGATTRLLESPSDSPQENKGSRLMLVVACCLAAIVLVLLYSSPEEESDLRAQLRVVRDARAADAAAMESERHRAIAEIVRLRADVSANENALKKTQDALRQNIQAFADSQSQSTTTGPLSLNPTSPETSAKPLTPKEELDLLLKQDAEIKDAITRNDSAFLAVSRGIAECRRAIAIQHIAIEAKKAGLPVDQRRVANEILEAHLSADALILMKGRSPDDAYFSDIPTNLDQASQLTRTLNQELRTAQHRLTLAQDELTKSQKELANLITEDAATLPDPR